VTSGAPGGGSGSRPDEDGVGGGPSLRLVVPYFGALPPYFELTLRSMERNPTVDWLLVTDQAVRPRADNVHVVAATFAGLRARIQDLYDFPIGLRSPYKLVDFKPAYGEIFADELAGYEWWGHCDLDVVFGRIRHNIPGGVFHLFDKLFVCGWLSLYRNDEAMTGLYRRCVDDVDYRRVLADDGVAQFDEWPGIYRILRAGGVAYWDDYLHLFDIDPHHYRPRDRKSPFAHLRYVWTDGILTETDAVSGNSREGVIMHIQKRAMRAPTPDVLAARSFALGPDRFYVGDRFDGQLPGRRSLEAGSAYVATRGRRWATRTRRRWGV
jgi:hypothetical protein